MGRRNRVFWMEWASEPGIGCRLLIHCYDCTSTVLKTVKSTFITQCPPIENIRWLAKHDNIFAIVDKQLLRIDAVSLVLTSQATNLTFPNCNYLRVVSDNGVGYVFTIRPEGNTVFKCKIHSITRPSNSQSLPLTTGINDKPKIKEENISEVLPVSDKKQNGKLEITLNICKKFGEAIQECKIVVSPLTILGQLPNCAKVKVPRNHCTRFIFNEKPHASGLKLEQIPIHSGQSIFVFFEHVPQIRHRESHTVSTKTKERDTQTATTSINKQTQTVLTNDAETSANKKRNLQKSFEVNQLVIPSTLPASEAEKQLRELQYKYNRLLIMMGKFGEQPSNI